ncbi:GYD domain-containing protein [Rhizobium tropici]|uniref:GYD domain-containing protein n=1 Tax=Rhizobium tropici TaxID=398 RepID=A0A5B0VQU7_RHITR|nr:GYD domain-containing protein [Rhizobium tropici]KAA1176903.1 GYD domain-containing protein [Rhizobium tropici]
MPLFIITGCYSAAAAKGMIADPSDREAAARAIMEAAGGKQHSFYVTTGETDWMIIAEFPDGVDLIPALLVVGASGAVSNIKTVRAYTGAEFKAAQKKAGKIASAYKAPAK